MFNRLHLYLQALALRANLTFKRDNGFTLIELLVVMIIIGLLAAIAIPVFLSQKHKANDTTAKSDIRQLAVNEETYYVDHGTYGSGTDLHNAGLDVKASKGNALLVFAAGAAGYCLGSTNAQGTPSQIQQGTGLVYWWDSVAGGLQKSESGYCPTYLANPGAYTTGAAVTHSDTIWANNWNGYTAP